jgi:flagellar export protein FliJ
MPPAFVYQNILDIRRTKVEVIEIQLGRLDKKLAELGEKKAAFIDLKGRLLVEMQHQMQGEIDVQQVDILRSNVILVDTGILRLDKEIEEVKKNRAQVHKSLIEARQDEKTLEILKDKANQRFNEEMKRVENLQQDDVYISLAYKQQRGY